MRTAAEAKDEAPQTNECCKNHEGSLKSMEADSALKLLIDFHNNTEKGILRIHCVQ